MGGKRTLAAVVAPIHFPKHHCVTDEERSESERAGDPPGDGLGFGEEEADTQRESHREIGGGADRSTLPRKRPVIEEAIRPEPRLVHRAN